MVSEATEPEKNPEGSEAQSESQQQESDQQSEARPDGYFPTTVSFEGQDAALKSEQPANEDSVELTEGESNSASEDG